MNLPPALIAQILGRRRRPSKAGRRAQIREKARIEMIRRGTKPDARMIAADYRANRA